MEALAWIVAGERYKGKLSYVSLLEAGGREGSGATGSGYEGSCHKKDTGLEMMYEARSRGDFTLMGKFNA